jgi:site-specific DNA-methyltransferase (adenine-specific)
MTPYYADDWVTLYHGDCLEIVDWLEADVLVTDPPYGIRWTAGTFSNAHHPEQTTIAGDDTLAARDDALSMWGDRPALVFGSWRVPRPVDTKNRLIWHKASALPGMRTSAWYAADEEIYQLGSGFIGRPEQNVIRTVERRDGAAGEVARLGHPTPKPTGLLEQLIRKCPPGVIADPFAGSGSTLIAARSLGRYSIGVEIDGRYCEVIAKRLSQGVLDFDEASA